MDILVPFLKAVTKHWWPLMSCALFTGLGMWIFYADKSNAWSIRATFVLAGFCLLVACFLAWRDEHSKVLAVENEKNRLQEKFFNDCPMLGIEVHSVRGPTAWAEHPIPVAFSLHLLSGRVPTAINFDPIPSLLGKFSLQFDAIPHVDKHPQGMVFWIHQVGLPRLNAHDLERIGTIEGKVLGCFLDDSPPELMELTYPLNAHFKDGDDLRDQSFQLTFDKSTFRFLPNTAV